MIKVNADVRRRSSLFQGLSAIQAKNFQTELAGGGKIDEISSESSSQSEKIVEKSRN